MSAGYSSRRFSALVVYFFDLIRGSRPSAIAARAIAETLKVTRKDHDRKRATDKKSSQKSRNGLPAYPLDSQDGPVTHLISTALFAGFRRRQRQSTRQAVQERGNTRIIRELMMAKRSPVSDLQARVDLIECGRGNASGGPQGKCKSANFPGIEKLGGRTDTAPRQK